MDFLRLQLDTLTKDLYPRAVKVGMLGSRELAEEVGRFLEGLKKQTHKKDDNDNEEAEATAEAETETETKMEQERESPFVVLDPVMISTSGHKLIEDEAKEAIIESIFPYVDVVTPNKFEAEELLGRKLTTPEDVEQGEYNNMSYAICYMLCVMCYDMMLNESIVWKIKRRRLR